MTFADIEDDVKSHDFIVIHTSTPSFKSDVKSAAMIRELNPTAKIGFIGAKVAVEPQQSLEAAPAIDFVCRNEYEFTIKELADGRRLVRRSRACPIADRTARSSTIDEREILMDMDKLPFVLPVYKPAQDREVFRRLSQASLLSIYTGRGCKSRCTFCLWPQTIGGHNYRARSIEPRHRRVKYVAEGISAR